MSIDIVIYQSTGKWTFEWIDAFVAGLQRHDIKPDVRKASDVRPSDIGVIWAHKHPQMFEIQQQHGGQYLVLERGYIGDRYRYTSLGFNGLNGHAQFPKANDDGDRWDRLFAHLMKPWRDPAEPGYVLLCGQVPGDASIECHDHNQWLHRMESFLMGMGETVMFRPHPQAVFGTPVQSIYGKFRCKVSKRPLEIDLAEARYVVTFNSNSGVDSIMHGIPAIAFDKGSMTWDVAGHDLGEVLMPDRTEWANDLAFTQWDINEMASGEAWENVRRCLI